MEPPVRYARTTDDVSIAYWSLGDGPPIVYMPPMAMHVQLDWRYPPAREMFEWLARGRQLVRFDERGRGLSQRDGLARTQESVLLDLDAVAAALHLDTFDLFGNGVNVESAIVYAARRPERIRRLICTEALVPFPETAELPEVRALRALLPVDWQLYNEVAAAMVWGWQGGQRSRQLAALLVASQTYEQRLHGLDRTTPESIESFLACLPLVTAPTLIVSHSEALFQSPATTRRLAGGLQDARLVLLEGDAVGGTFNDPLAMAAVDEFLAGTEGAEPAEGLPAGMAVIMFVDIENSTALTERMGDSAFRDSSRALDERVRAAIRDAGGATVEGKVMGDGVMGVFTSAAQAIGAANACRDLSAASELRLHIGLHAGDVIREGNNVYGGAVNIAARVCDASTPGEILVSATVRDLARTSAGVTFEDRGERALKGIEDSVRVFAVGLRPAHSA